MAENVQQSTVGNKTCTSQEDSTNESDLHSCVQMPVNKLVHPQTCYDKEGYGASQLDNALNTFEGRPSKNVGIPSKIKDFVMF